MNAVATFLTRWHLVRATIVNALPNIPTIITITIEAAPKFKAHVGNLL